VKKVLGLVHSKVAEAKPLIGMLERAGYTVHYGTEVKSIRATALRKLDAMAAVIDLTRMPSYGKYWAAELRATSLKHLPILFVDGAPDKVEMVKAALPDAQYVTSDKLLDALKRVKPVANPVEPVRMMLSDQNAAHKIGIKANTRVAVFDPPAGYAQVIGEMPDGASFEEQPEEIAPVTIWFVRDIDVYLAGLRDMRKLAAKSKLWVVYPKLKLKQSGGLNQNSIRESATKVGLVDYKICSVNQTWSGMAFALKK